VENTEAPAAAKIQFDPAALQKLNVRISRNRYCFSRPTSVNGNTRNLLHSTKKTAARIFLRNVQIPNNHAGCRTPSPTEGPKTKGLECRIQYDFLYVALHRKYDFLLPSLADRPGRTLKDSLCPESHRDGQLIHNISGAVWRAIDRDHNQLNSGEQRIRLFKIGKLLFQGAAISADWALVGTIMKTKFVYSNGSFLSDKFIP
jgi:hypothetical protein